MSIWDVDLVVANCSCIEFAIISCCDWPRRNGSQIAESVAEGGHMP